VACDLDATSLWLSGQQRWCLLGCFHPEQEIILKNIAHPPTTFLNLSNKAHTPSKTIKMLLDEDPATVSFIFKFSNATTNKIQLIHHTIGNFNIQPDKLAVARINESLSTLQQARDLRVREAESAVKSTLTQCTNPAQILTVNRTLPNPHNTQQSPSRNTLISFINGTRL